MRVFDRTLRALGVSVILVSLTCLCPSRATAAAKSVTFEEYQKLDDAARRRMIDRYVKRAAGGQWEVLLKSYHIRTDVSDEAALALAAKMDEFYAGFRNVFTGSFRIRARPMLYAMKDKTSYHSAIGKWSAGRMNVPSWSAGCFATMGRKYALFGCNEWGVDRMYTTLFHEGTHHLLHFYIGRKFPRWFDEGVATNFQDWDVSLSAERNVYESIWKSRYPPILRAMTEQKEHRGKKLPKPDLIKLMASGDSDWLHTADPIIWYAQGWGFLNFLLSSGKDGQHNVNTLIVSFRKGKRFHKVAPMPIRVALAGQYLEYMETVIVPHVDYSVPVRELMQAGNPEDASIMVQEGLKDHPKSFELIYFKGLIELEQGRAKDAYDTLKRLEKKKPRHPHLIRTLGLAALAAGDKVKGRSWLKKALGENYRDEEVRKLLK